MPAETLDTSMIAVICTSTSKRLSVALTESIRMYPSAGSQDAPEIVSVTEALFNSSRHMLFAATRQIMLLRLVTMDAQLPRSREFPRS